MSPLFWLICTLLCTGVLCGAKYRLCLVSSLHDLKKTNKHCQAINDAESKVECVFGNSRLECLYFLLLQKADFGIFEPEVIEVAVQDKISDLVVTNELRLMDESVTEYKLAVIVRNSAGVKSITDLKNKTFCLPGIGYERDWNNLMTTYFERRVVPQQCSNSLSLLENYFQSLSLYYHKACIAGQWSSDGEQDKILKRRYANLCSLCGDPMDCSSLDTYWGRTGPLHCLTQNGGEVAWARLDDIIDYFGVVQGAENFSLLCKDGSLRNISGDSHCSWVSRPWPAVLARKQIAEDIQKLVMSANKKSESWVQSLQFLLNSAQQKPVSLRVVKTPEEYLSSVDGFRELYFKRQCDQDRNVKLCTTDAEQLKCEWLGKAATAYGILPELVCERTNSTEDCLALLMKDKVDAVAIDSEKTTYLDFRSDIKPALFEYSSNLGSMNKLIAFTRVNSSITSLAQLRGRKACFPNYKRIAWNSVIVALNELDLLPNICPFDVAVAEFFGDSCVPGADNDLKSLRYLCPGENQEREFTGDYGAFRCLESGKGDVAFVSSNNIRNISDSPLLKDFGLICGNETVDTCDLSWETFGQLMVNSEVSEDRLSEIKNMFMRMSDYFTKRSKQQIQIFQLFGQFDGLTNAIFKDDAEMFEDLTGLRKSQFSRNYEVLMEDLPDCKSAALQSHSYFTFTMLVSFWAVYI